MMPRLSRGRRLCGTGRLNSIARTVVEILGQLVGQVARPDPLLGPGDLLGAGPPVEEEVVPVDGPHYCK